MENDVATNEVTTQVNSKKHKRLNYDRYGYYFILPFIIVFLLFQLYPIAYTIYLSFTNLHGLSTHYDLVGLKNYTKLIHNTFFFNSLKNTLILWIVNFIPQMGLALLLAAWFTNIRLKLKGVGLIRTLIYMPNLLVPATVAVLFASLFAYPTGPINGLLIKWGWFSSSFNFFQDINATRSLVSSIQCWMWYGQTLILLMAGMTAIPVSLYESAMVDGANDRVVFRKITLPLLRPVMLYLFVTSLIGGLQMFDIPFLITDNVGSPSGSINTATMGIYNQAFRGNFNYAYASTLAVGLFIITVTLSLFVFYFMRNKDASKAKAKLKARAKKGVRI